MKSSRSCGCTSVWTLPKPGGGRWMAAPACADATDKGQAHPVKAGPCVKFSGLEPFIRLRAKLDGCLTGCRLAKDRAADALTKVMTREALDYPV